MAIYRNLQSNHTIRFEDGDIVEGDNLSQLYSPAGPLCVDQGKKVEFRRVNLKNGLLSKGSVAVDCLEGWGPDPVTECELGD